MRTTGFIDASGKYHPGQAIEVNTDTAVTDKQYQHDRQRENHRADIVQPYKNGKPNEEFILLYPEQSETNGFI